MAIIKIRPDFDDYEEDLPKNIDAEYREGVNYKSALGQNGCSGLGLYEQTKLNEDFMLDNHWKGADVGDMATVTVNVIRQIADYKNSNITSNPIEAYYSFEGVPSQLEPEQKSDVSRIQSTMDSVANTPLVPGAEPQTTTEDELNAVADAMTAHFRTTWERCQVDKLNQTGVRKASISGSYVLYSPFNPNIKTGLNKKGESKYNEGDIDTEILDITNVYFKEPSITHLQKQPSIIISQRKTIKEISRLAKMNKIKQDEIDGIVSNTEMQYEATNVIETTDLLNATLLTKFWKEYQEDGSYKIMCTKICGEIVIQKPFDIGLQLYPLAIFPMIERDNCIYGYSEITGMISQQIMINRMISLEFMCALLVGLPKIIYNADVIDEADITNSPGELIPVRSGQDVQNSIRYLSPSNISPNWERATQNLIDNTKTIAGATQAALGDLRPENTSAIIAVREAATLPLQPTLMRFYAFIEDVARIWGEIMLKKYGTRKLKIKKDGKVYYVPFDASRYEDMLLSVRIEVGTSTLWSASTIISTLNNLLMLGKIDIIDFLERIPDGYISKRQDLINTLKVRQEQMAQQAQAQAIAEQQAKQPQEEQPETIDINNLMSQLDDTQLAALQENPDLLNKVMQNANGGGA